MIRSDDNPTRRRVTRACTLPLGMGFMTHAAVMAYLAEPRCLLCGRWLAAIGNHVVRIHKITAREYRHQFGIPATYPLDLPDVTRARSRGVSVLARMQKAEQMRNTPHPKGPQPGHWHSPATRNLRAIKAYQMHEQEK